MARACEVWHMARVYAASDILPDEPPPWHPQSDYSLVMLRILELDSRFPLRYRFATNDFGGQTPEALHGRRDYWAPWLFIQFIHAATPTLLNHPFLLSLRLRNFRGMLPTTFMQQSFEQISRHTAWTMHYLDLVERQQFQVSDPFIGNFVAILATIHLQHSFVQDEVFRKKAQNGYEKCIRFLDRMADIWPCVSYIVCTWTASSQLLSRADAHPCFWRPTTCGSSRPALRPCRTPTVQVQLLAGSREPPGQLTPSCFGTS